MTRVLAPEEVVPAVPAQTATAKKGAVLLLLMLLFAVFAVWRLNPPEAVAANAPPAEFSSARALEHIKVIAARPHPVGSAEHEAVRKYIVERLASLGLTAEVQDAVAVIQNRGVPYQGGAVHNVVATVKGTGGEGALMLVGHYDSVPTGPGASDDGSAVASMLETARALKAGPPLSNDVIFLFSDAEEVGLLGAQAFVEGHPRARDVRLVLNFDARGNRGPATMFETSTGNDWLIRQFAESAPHPSANSLSYEVYKLLPNTTDMTVFKDAGFAGLNFAFVKGAVYYHTALDAPETMDERSLQHQGSTALALARRFGGQNLSETKSGDAVYFDLLGYGVVRYGASLVLPVMVLAMLLFGVAVALARDRGVLTLRDVAWGFAAQLAGLIGAAVVVTAAWWLVSALHAGYGSFLTGDVYDSGAYMLGLVLIGAALAVAPFALLMKRARAESLALGAMLWWLLLTVATSLTLPGASYLFAWPLIFVALTFSVALIARGKSPRDTPLKEIVLLLGALPALALLVPTIYMVFLALTLNLSGVVAVLVALSVGLLISHFGLLMSARRWLLPAALAAAGVLLIGVGALTSGFDAGRRSENNLIYALDADTSRAVWASADAAPDAWTRQFFGGASRGRLEGFFPLSMRTFMQAPAPAASLAPPRVEMRGDETNGGVRTLHLHVSSERSSPVVTVALDPELRVSGSSVNGKRLDAEANMQGEPWALRYYGLPAEGLDMTLEVGAGKSVALRVIEQNYGLPQLPGATFTPRPDSMMASTLPFSDSTYVSKSYTF